MAVYAIGDLQGCYEEFRRLLDRLQFDPAADRLWLTGDLVNRGPGSLQVLRFVRGLGAAAATVLGNHDLHLLAIARAGTRSHKTGDTLEDVLAAGDRDELLDWLAGRPLLHEEAGLDWTLVHAGLAPEWDLPTARALAREVEAALANAPAALYQAMYGDLPDRWDPGLSGLERLRFAINCFTRLRYCTAEGQLLLKLKGPPETAPPGALAWFAVPGRRSAGRRIVFGHWSALGYRALNDAYSLDTGCVWGGQLTALRLDAPELPVFVACTARLGWAELD